MIMPGKHSLLQEAIRHIHRRSPRRVCCTSTQAALRDLALFVSCGTLFHSCNQAFRHVDYLFLRTCSATMFAVYLLSDPDGPPTAFLLFRPQCTVGVLAGTHRGALRCPGGKASGTKRQPLSAAAALLLHCCCTAAALLLHCCCTADTCYQTHPFGQAHVSWVLADLDSTYDSLCHLHAVRDFLMYSASPSTTMTTFSSSSLFFSSSSPRSDPSFVVDFSFLPPNSSGMTVTGSSLCDFFNDALGNAFLCRTDTTLNNAFGISFVHVTRSLLPPSQILLVISSRCQHCSRMWKSR